MTREEAISRFRAAKQRKHQHAMELVDCMRELYKAETGRELISYEIW